MNNINGLCKKYHDGKTAIRLAKVKLEEKVQKVSEQRTAVNEVNLENFFNKANIMLAVLNTRFNGVDGGVAFTQDVIQNEGANVPILGSDMVVDLYSPALVRKTTFNVTNNASLLNMIKDYAEAVIKIMRNFDYDRYYSLSHDLEKLHNVDPQFIPQIEILMLFLQSNHSTKNPVF